MANVDYFPVCVDNVNISCDTEALAKSTLTTREIIDGNVTKEQFEEVFGNEANMVEYICHETHDNDGFSIKVFLCDVIACENRISHHSVFINSYLEKSGMPQLNEEEIQRRARDYDDITPEAAFFLVYLTEWGLDATQIEMSSMDEALGLMEREGLTIDDFLRAEG